MGRALQIQGIRSKLDLSNGEKKHDWKTLHGFCKFFKNQTRRVMKSLNVEILMGLANSYYKPSEREHLEDYIKAAKLLTVNRNDNRQLEKEIRELKDKNQKNEYTINAKLQEKDDAFISLSDQVMKLMTEVQELRAERQKPNSFNT
jgi:CTP synthase (UTP-ammonia lyase)